MLRLAGVGRRMLVKPDAAGRRSGARLVAALCVTQTTSWGTLYYALPVTSGQIAADTGWSVLSITSAFSAGLILSAAAGIPAGRLLDRFGARAVMTTGSVLGVAGLVLVAAAPSLAWFLTAWAITGLAQAVTLYQAAFTVINRTFGQRRATALTVVTLAAGLASTIFAPVAAALTGSLGWRGSFLVLAGILAVVVVPLNAFSLPSRWPHGAAREHPADALTVRRIVGSRPFLLLQAALTLVALALYAATLNFVPILTARGYSPAFAALVFGLIGVGQVGGRLLFLTGRPAARHTLTIVVIAAGAAIILALIALDAGPAVVLVILAVCAGAIRGAVTLTQASAVAERWGTGRLGLLNGIFTAPITAATALAPAIGVGLAVLAGSYSAALAILAGACALGALAAAFSRPRPLSDDAIRAN